MNQTTFTTPRIRVASFLMSLGMTLVMLLGTNFLATQDTSHASLQMAGQPAASAPSAS